MSEWDKEKAIEFIENMQQDIEKQVNMVISSFSDRNKQQLITEMVRYVDFLFEWDVINTCSISKKMANIVEFALPSFFHCVAYADKGLTGNLLAPSNAERKKQIEQILEVQQIYGLLKTCKDYVTANMMQVVEIKENEMKLQFKELYHDLERIDRVSVVLHSNSVLHDIMPYNLILSKKLKTVQGEMEKLVYKWREDFIGYGADSEVDDLYIKHAALDLIQSTEWNVFEPEDKFGGIPYAIYIDAVIGLESLSLKHLQFIYLALGKYKNLDKYNLLPVYETKDTICEMLETLLGVSREEAIIVMETLVLRQEDMENIEKYNIPLPPYLEIANEYFIRSFAGCLYEPTEYVLFNLKRFYQKDWDRNIQKREKIFRQEFYGLFSDDLYEKYNRNIDIKIEGKLITDIDACLYEKNSGDILFVQLKWQDSIYDSFSSMISKRKNYFEKVEEWILTMKTWIEETPEEIIANYLHLKSYQVKKEKIHLLIVGRYNGEYSTSGVSEKGIPYCQWYELKRVLEENKEKINIGSWGIRRIYMELLELMRKREQKRSIVSGIQYGEKRIVYDGLFYNEA